MTATERQQRMRRYIQLVATGPELSKSLSAEEAEDGITSILKGDIDPVRCGIFLIALRMKRETDEENIGVLNGLNRFLVQATCDAPEVIALADPFNGYARGLPATVFLPALLAACGLPAYAHGLEKAGPKYGLTMHMILAAAGKRVDLSVEAAAAALDGEPGWAYLDQSMYIPPLHELVPLRDRMVKRSCLSTLEVVLKPLAGSRSTHLMTGFVHKAYPPVYAALAKHAGYDSAMIVRGVEGGCIPSLSQVSRYFGYTAHGELSLNKLSPRAIGIDQSERAVPIPQALAELPQQSTFDDTDTLAPLAERAASLGLSALAGESGPTYDSLVYGAAIALFHCARVESLEAGARLARERLDSGAARARFEAAV